MVGSDEAAIAWRCLQAGLPEEPPHLVESDAVPKPRCRAKCRWTCGCPIHFSYPCFAFYASGLAFAPAHGACAAPAQPPCGTRLVLTD